MRKLSPVKLHCMLVPITCLLPVNQSGFRKTFHWASLASPTFRYIYSTTNRAQITLLALFDVRTSFDTVDQWPWPSYLSSINFFGISGKPFEWLHAFLWGRMFSTVFGFTRSHQIVTPSGLWQVIVLSPLLYILYTADNATVQAFCGVLMIFRLICTVLHPMLWMQ